MGQGIHKVPLCKRLKIVLSDMLSNATTTKESKKKTNEEDGFPFVSLYHHKFYRWNMTCPFIFAHIHSSNEQNVHLPLLKQMSHLSHTNMIKLFQQYVPNQVRDKMKELNHNALCHLHQQVKDRQLIGYDHVGSRFKKFLDHVCFP